MGSEDNNTEDEIRSTSEEDCQAVNGRLLFLASILCSFAFVEGWMKHNLV